MFSLQRLIIRWKTSLPALVSLVPWLMLRTSMSAGSGLKGISINFGKKPTDADESRRNTCKQSYLSTCANELSMLTSFGGERKQLVPVSVCNHLTLGYLKSS